MEPIGGLTVYSLLLALLNGNPALCGADVEWHIVPCIDPDGAKLNESWSQQPFSFHKYLRGFYLEPPADQVDTSFPITHKKLSVDRPSNEATILKHIMDQSRPDFFFSLHNTLVGGTFCFVSRDIGSSWYRQIAELMQQEGFTVQRRPLWREMSASFADGVVEMFSIRRYYDYLEKTSDSPETAIHFGAGSWDYLAEIKPDALTFVAEMGYVRHPWDDSNEVLDVNFRQFLLRLDAESRYIATVMLAEWETVKSDVDPASPFYAALINAKFLATLQELTEGRAQLGRYPLSEILRNPEYDRPMTAGDQLSACVDSIYFLAARCQFLRLLKASAQTDAIRSATQRLERFFDEAFTQIIGNHINLNAFEAYDARTLARVQMGSGLLALNSVLEARRVGAQGISFASDVERAGRAP